MEFIKKNKIVVGVVIVIIVVLAGAFILTQKGAGPATPTTNNQTQNVKVLQPSDIGLELSIRDDKRAVEMTISKLSGVKTIEYEASYNAKVTDTSINSEDGGESGDVPRGVVASPIDVNGQSSIHKEILLGTCSSGTCKYDNVTSAIKFIIKVTYTNGEVGSVETSVPFN